MKPRLHDAEDETAAAVARTEAVAPPTPWNVAEEVDAAENFVGMGAT